MAHRRAMLAIVVGAILLSYAIPASGDSLTVYRLEPSSGWVELPPVNPYATAVRENPLQGWSNAGATSWPLKATAKFEPDTKKAELTVEFIPISRDIRANAGNLFIAPLGRRLEWRLVVTVRNPNDIPMKQVKVRDEFGPAFRATLAGGPAGDARIEGDDPRGMLPLHPTLVWDIGELGPGEAARAEVTVVTNRDGQGSQQFSHDGIYSIDTGARLTYVLAGQPQVRNASSGSVIARKDADALRGDGTPFGVGPRPIAGEGTGAGSVVPVLPPIVDESLQARAVIRRVDVDHEVGTRDIARASGRFDVVAAAKTANVAEVGTGIDRKFVVPPGQYAEWEVGITITNLTDQGWWQWTMAMTFGTELSVEEIPGTRDIIEGPGGTDPGTGDPLTITTLADGRKEVTWGWSGDWSQFVKDSQAVVKLKVYTTSPTGYAASPDDYIFCHNMMLHFLRYNNIPATIWLDPIYVHAGALASVTVSATRLDWRVRKAGTYAALATEMSFTGVGNLSVQFDGFADLARLDGGAAVIGASYGFGNDLAAVEASGWIAADDLNSSANWPDPIPLDPANPQTLRMWSRIAVGDEDSSCEYEDAGVITFIVSNNQP
ncbi:MAG: hypothetical protein AB1774_05525 [Bacillota bacterium]